MTELKTFIFKLLNSKYAALSKPASYGTAGFRDIATNLNTICYRVGAFAALLSYKLQGKYCGIMITASHNPIQDNGIKIVEPTGEMLDSSFEKPLEILINSKNQDEIVDTIYKAMPDLKFNTKSRVCIAFDTRPSSPQLCQCAIDGIMTMSGEAFNYKLLTTPELHYMTYTSNRDSNITPEKVYYDEFSKAFKDLIKPATKKNYQNELTLDCSNGVGSLKLEFYDPCSSIFQIKPINFANGDNAKLLNNECGADYINIKRVYPRNVVVGKATKKYAAYDGDADRLIYFYNNVKGEFRIINGDKIAALICKVVCGYSSVLPPTSRPSIGMVQTAYTNSSATTYVREKLKVNVDITPTGVKYLHKQAKKYDIGIYFEANGHGTVLTNFNNLNMIKKQLTEQAHIDAVNNLITYLKLGNHTVGDALANVLLVEAALFINDMKIEDVDAFYEDVISYQEKVPVLDRSKYISNKTEERLIEPLFIQQFIDSIVTKGERAFVRASGTESIVRIYTEGATIERAMKISKMIREKIEETKS